MSAGQSLLARRLDSIRMLPAAWQNRVLNWMVARAVPFVGQGGIRVCQLSPACVELEMPHRPRVLNHIGTIHAAAAVLLAETAGGLAFALALPPGRTPVVKSLHFDYRRRFSGALRAKASIAASDAERLALTERGEIRISIRLSDAAGSAPADCELIYAWTIDRAKGA